MVLLKLIYSLRPQWFVHLSIWGCPKLWVLSSTVRKAAFAVKAGDTFKLVMSINLVHHEVLSPNGCDMGHKIRCLGGFFSANEITCSRKWFGSSGEMVIPIFRPLAMGNSTYASWVMTLSECLPLLSWSLNGVTGKLTDVATGWQISLWLVPKLATLVVFSRRSLSSCCYWLLYWCFLALCPV